MNEMKNEIDYELVFAYILEITDRFKIISDLIKDEISLKQLASCSIHLALFSKEIADQVNPNRKILIDNLNDFYKECGCGFNQSKWISTKYSLPKEGLRVLFVCKDLDKILMGHHIRDGLMQFSPSINGHPSNDNSPIIIDMTHWMPLPDLPE